MRSFVALIPIMVLVKLSDGERKCGPPTEHRRLRYDNGNMFHEKRLRNKNQCFNLCWNTSPCLSINFSYRTRRCTLLSKRANSRLDLSIDFNVVYGEVIIPLCKSSYSPCDRRPCKRHATCIAYTSKNHQCITAKPPRIRCGKVPLLENAKYSVRGKDAHRVAVYTCIKGFKFKGRKNKHVCTRTRGRRGRWKGLRGSCKKKKCPEPSVLMNADLDSGDVDVGTERIYTCRHDKSRTGSSRCLNNQTWSEVDLTCPGDCGNPPNVSGSMVSEGDTKEGSVREYTCNLGRVAKGDTFVTCLPNGTWTHTNLQCQVDCGTSPSVQHAQLKMNMGSTIQYQCDTGFTPEGDNSSICTENGIWSNVTLTCSPVDCGPPPAVEHAEANFHSSLVNSSVQYLCKKGFRSDNEESIMCQEDGTWTNPTMECVPVVCEIPPPIGHIQDVNGTYEYGETVRLSCANSFYAVGDPVLRCDETGQWEKKNFQCRGNNPQVLVAVKDTKSFHTINVTSKETKKLNITGTDSIQDVDYCLRTETIYWVESNVIRSALIEGNASSVVHSETGIGGFVRVDTASGFVFSAVRGNMTSLVRVQLHGAAAKSESLILVDTPLALEIDRNKKLVYWAEWVNEKQVRQMTYDGSNVTTVVKLDKCDLGPWAVHVDENTRLYWSVNDEVHMREPGHNNGTVLRKFKNICDGIRTHRDAVFVSCTNDSSVRMHNSQGLTTLELGVDVVGGEKFITVIP